MGYFYVSEVFAVECSQSFVGDEVYQRGAREFVYCAIYAAGTQYASQFCATIDSSCFQARAVFKMLLDNPAHEFPIVYYCEGVADGQAA